MDASLVNSVRGSVLNLRGTNPTAIEATQYLATQQNSAGFEKILEHESKFKQFSRPIRAGPAR